MQSYLRELKELIHCVENRLLKYFLNFLYKMCVRFTVVFKRVCNIQENDDRN
jgi:hypothetical protein